MYLSLHPRLTKTLNANPGAVVQLVRMPACHAGGRGFEPLPHRTNKVHPFGSDLICFLCLKEPSTSAILFHIRLFQTSQFLGQRERFGQFLRPTSQFLGQREHFRRFLCPSPWLMTGTRTFSAVFAPVPRADGGPSDRTGNNRPARRADS